MSASEPGKRPFLPDFCEQVNLPRTMVIAQLLVFVLVAATPGDWFERLRSLATMSPCPADSIADWPGSTIGWRHSRPSGCCSS